MPDQNPANASGGQPTNVGTPPGGAAPANQTPTTDNQPKIDPQEFARLQRLEQQYTGSRQLYDKVRGHFADDAQMEQAAQFYKAMQAKKIDPKSFLAAMSDPEPDGKPQQPEDIDSRVQALLDKRERERAEREHRTAAESEFSELADEKIESLFGHTKDTPAELKALAQAAMLGAYAKGRKPYPDGHPLAGQYAPLGPEGLKAAQAQVKGWFEAALKSAKASVASQIGNAARKASTPAGNAGGQQAATPESDSSPTSLEEHFARAHAAAKASLVR